MPVSSCRKPNLGFLRVRSYRFLDCVTILEHHNHRHLYLDVSVVVRVNHDGFIWGQRLRMQLVRHGGQPYLIDLLSN